jgi:dipeptidyl aminopeptidase/acylaminoacyl peptidase
MKKITLALLALALAAASAAQQRTPLTQSDYTAAERFSPAKVRQMVGSTSVAVNWLDNSNCFWYRYTTAEGERWWFVDPDRRVRRPLFDNDRMAAEITRVTRDPYDGQHLPFSTVRFTADERAFRFTVESKVDEVEEIDRETGEKKKVKKKFVFECDLASGTIRHLEDHKTVQTPDWGSVSPDGRTVIYGKDFNLWSMDWENYQKAMLNQRDSTIVETQITKDGERYFGFGSPTINTRDDPEKKKLERYRVGLAWSPDSQNYLVTKTDTRNVKDLWVINHTARPRPTLETYRYQMPGEEGAPVPHLLVGNVASGTFREIDASAFKNQTIQILSDSQKRYFAHKTDDYTILSRVWKGSDSEFLIQRASRDLKRIDICRVDLATLTVDNVIEERFNTYLEPADPMWISGPGSDLVHWSEEDGWAHLYLYSWKGERLRQLTSGPWHVERVVEIDPATRTIYFTASGREKGINPYYTFLYRINADGTGLQLLSPGDINHGVNMSERRRYWVDNSSRVDAAPTSALFNAAGQKVMDLETTDLSRLVASGYKFPTPFKVKAADGITDLWGVYYLPFDLDSTKLYPIVEYVYPGPQTEGVNHTFTAPGYRLEQLAQLGFVVVTVGNRGGHPSRSKWYHTYGYGNLRDYGLADKKAAAIQIADRLPFADITRVGITGHSGGGFMSTAAILQYPEFFKVAVSCAGNHDNSIYNRWWSETHHGVKEEIKETNGVSDTTFVYSIANNQQLAANLRGRLLLLHGDVDNNVHPANTLMVVEALIKAGKRFDMMILPGQAHAFGGMTDYFFWMMADYFSEHLIGDRQNTVDIPQLKE